MMRSGWVFFAMLFSIGANSITLADDPDYGNQLPRIAPTASAAALASFAVADGFEIQLVAAEPLVASPVAIEWDESGAMFVCEMRGYSENRDDSISRIARLSDDDGDGMYDSRTTYADGLNWPTGMFPFDGGLFVGDAPDLWYFKDTDGDGVSDVKQRVLTGFGTSNVQGLMNSFRWGLDNRIHIACSSVGGEIRAGHAADDAESVSIRGRDIALDPKTYLFEPTSGAAQHGMCFDDWGRKFVSSNSDHIQQVMYEDRYIARNPYVIPPPSRISIAADGPQAEVFRTSPVEPWRILRTRLRISGQAKGPIEGGGRAAGYFTGATGLTIYRGDAWPAKWEGTAIIGDVGSNLIHRKQLHENGLEFVAKRIDPSSEFVTSTDIWFRPAQFANAPDGTLHVVDVYREVIEHPLSLPEEIKKHLDLTSGRDRGRIYRLLAKDAPLRQQTNLQVASTLELVQTLAHDNAWHRETAARLLYERQDPAAVKPLRVLASEASSPLGRMHAMYALSGLRALDQTILLHGLQDTHAQVRRHAVRLADTIAASDEFTNTLVRLADDASIEVRYQLAFTLGSWTGSEKMKALAMIAKQDPSNRWITAAVLNSVGSEASQLKSFLASDLTELAKQLDEQIATRGRVADASTGRKMHREPQSVATRSAETIAQRNAIVARYQDTLTMPGDLDRGREQFKKHCSACHRVEGIGHEIGPNLATIKARGAETVLSAVLDPNREVNPQYVNYSIVTLDGRVLTGMIMDEGATSVTFRRAGNITESVLRIEIDQIKNTGLSIMPEGFENLIDRQAMADIIGYLMQAQ